MTDDDLLSMREDLHTVRDLLFMVLLAPFVIVALLIVVGLALIPQKMIRGFQVFSRALVVVITIGLILGAASGISVMMSALMHNASTILVVANSLRLMFFPPMEGR